MKRYQVFISSTYEDLKDERQAAVQAILKAGHIPAGMELFTAGDQSQMDVIEQWIKQSDIFMLILGGRYGSIEPTSGKSYTELEYDLAAKLGIPSFAVVITDPGLDRKVEKQGRKVVLESENESLYREFKKRVKSNLCGFFGDLTEVKLAVHETLPQITSTRELSGWVSAAEIESPAEFAKQIAKLSAENMELRRNLEKLKASSGGSDPGDLLLELERRKVVIPQGLFGGTDSYQSTLLNLASHFAGQLATGVTNAYGAGKLESFLYYHVATPLAGLGLAAAESKAGNIKWQRIKLTKEAVKLFATVQVTLKQDKLGVAPLPQNAASTPKKPAKKKSK